MFNGRQSHNLMGLGSLWICYNIYEIALLCIYESVEFSTKISLDRWKLVDFELLMELFIYFSLM
jgi:hypothetical protein